VRTSVGRPLWLPWGGNRQKSLSVAGLWGLVDLQHHRIRLAVPPGVELAIEQQQGDRPRRSNEHSKGGGGSGKRR